MMLKFLDPKSSQIAIRSFSRDIAFVIEDKLIKANILPDRGKRI